MTKDEIDETIDNINIDNVGCDSAYYLKANGYRVRFGGLLFGENKDENLRDSFDCWKLIDKGTEIKITNDGEFGIIRGVSYDLANLSNKEENGLLLTLLRMAAIEVIKEQNS